jgi:2-methylisocitrate lyase-like PEP mutase family enzyme
MGGHSALRFAPSAFTRAALLQEKRFPTMSQADILRTLIQAPDLLVMPGIFDGFSARLVEQAGFSAGFISGGGLSETLLGYSDVGLMGFELNLAAVTRLAACCTIPLLADADTCGPQKLSWHRQAAFFSRQYS